jgi:hypothetical protein
MGGFTPQNNCLGQAQTAMDEVATRLPLELYAVALP